MADGGLIDGTTRLLKKTLDLRMRKQQVISSNIANAQTPRYLAKKFEFIDELQQAVSNPSQGMWVTNPRHIAGTGGTLDNVQGRLSTVPDRSGLGDGNTVKMEEEMVDLAQNQIMFEAATQMLNKKLAIIKYVVQGQ